MQSTQVEQWRPIPGFGGNYEASTLGRIRSLDRIRPTTNHRIRGKVLSPAIRPKYQHVNLYVGARQATIRVHQLVMLAFVGPCPDGCEVLHRNGDGHDNRPENLRYGTRQENIRDQLVHGTQANAAKTECIRGHSFSGVNLIERARVEDGKRFASRICRACQGERERARKAGRPFDALGADLLYADYLDAAA